MHLVREQATRQGVTLVTDMSRACPCAVMDRTESSRPTLNLVRNALEAMPEGGRLTLETMSEPDGRVALSVADTGPGIADEFRFQLFDPFFTTKPSGTGLGLSLSAHIVRDHEGYIDVQNAPAAGRASPSSCPRRARGGGLRVRGREAGARRGKAGRRVSARILVIDDEDELRRSVGKILARMGHEVESAANATQGLDLVARTRFELILTDFRLPDLDGIEVLTRARALQPDAEIVLLTAFASIPLAVQAVNRARTTFCRSRSSARSSSVWSSGRLQKQALAAENRRLRLPVDGQGRSPLDRIIGRSEAIRGCCGWSSRSRQARRPCSSPARAAPERKWSPRRSIAESRAATAPWSR